MSYETRRSDLKPEVRKYADKLYARLREIYKKYGASDAAGVLANAKARKGPRLEKKDVEEMKGLLDLLDEALTKSGAQY